jgi:hypothetical protein
VTDGVTEGAIDRARRGRTSLAFDPAAPEAPRRV